MTSVLNIALLAMYVSVSVGGLTLMKLGQGFNDWITWLGFALYGAGFGLWFVFLMRVPLSRAFPLAAGCLIVATQLAGRYVLKEELSHQMLFGVGLMLIAITIIFRS